MKKVTLLFMLSLCLTSFTANEKVGWELASGIYILDKETPIKSLTELTTRLKGKKIYVDRWATWCSPCLKEFDHVDALHQYFDSNNILLVYLNSDKNIQEDEWFAFIKAHDLKGYHLRLNDELKADLTDREIFFPMIPQYIVINDEGSVVENRALRPSDGVRLHHQLDSLLNN